MNVSTATTLSLPRNTGDVVVEPGTLMPVPEVPLLVFSRLLQGDQRLREKLHLSEADLDCLRSLPPESLPRLLSRMACSGIVEVRLHRKALHNLLCHLKHACRAEHGIRSMIHAHALPPFLKHFYDMPYPVYHQYRQQAGLLRSAGRPSRPEKQVVDRITALFQKLDLLPPSTTTGPCDLPSAARYLVGLPAVRVC